MASLGQLSTQDGQGGQDESGCSEPLALASKNEGEPRQVSDEPISNSSSTNGSSDRVDPIPGKPRDQSVAKEEDDDDGGVANEDGGAETSTSSQGSRAGYTADCSSDASSDLSASTKKKAKDNIILPVKNLSIKDTNIDTDDCSENDSSGMSLATGPEKDNFTGQQTRRNDRQKRHRRKRSDDKTAKSFDSVSSASSDSRQPPVQLNGVQIVHPMDPRIDIRRVGYIHEQPDVPHGRQQQQQQQHLPASDHTDNAPSLENYLQLMEVVRPFFSSHGIGETKSTGGEEPLQYSKDENSKTSSSSSSLGESRKASSRSSNSLAKPPKIAPLHLRQEDTLDASKPPPIPLQLAARQQPLQAAADAEFYAPDDDPVDIDDDESETSSMIVLARTKKKHKQPSCASSEQATQERSPENADNANEPASQAQNDDMDVDLEDDREPAARIDTQKVLSYRARFQTPDEGQEAAAEDPVLSSSSGQRSIQHQVAQLNTQQAKHNYDDTRVVTESSNANTTTSGSGSGSGGNSGSNQGSSGSGNGSSGNGSSGSGNEEKGSNDDDVRAKEGTLEEGNSNSEDVNSDEQKLAAEKETIYPVVARRYSTDATKVDAPSPQVMLDQNEADRERKLQVKKRKRMDMRREYEEQVEDEMESSESSVTKGAIDLRPGRPITLDKVLSFSKFARILIQACPPFLVVHTNAAYTRLTGIDAHAAVGKPVSALLSVQGPDRLHAEADASNQEVGQENVNQQQQQLDPIAFQSVTGDTIQSLAEAHTERAAQASVNVNLERLVAACGFGKYHLLYAKARPHQMVGRNITIVARAGLSAALPAAAADVKSVREHDDPNVETSQMRFFVGPFDCVKCRASISPIVSAYPEAITTTNTNHQEPHVYKSKRRKHHHGHGSLHPNTGSYSDSTVPRQDHRGITHYAIQIDLVDDSKELNEKRSCSTSSTSVEANLLGLSKAELLRQRQASNPGRQPELQVAQQDDDGMASETTEGTVAVTVVA